MPAADDWPSDMPVTQVRIARPTNQLSEVVRFYGEGLGLKQIGSFQGHAGYDGVMFGLPGSEYHLEFTAPAEAGADGVRKLESGAGSRELGARAEEVGTACDSGRAFDGRNPTVKEGAAARFAPPSRDNLLVLYLPDRSAVDRLASRLAAMGYPAVEPENPYWAERGVTIEDPDGWRVVLMNTAGI